MASDIELAKSLFNVADKGDTVQNSYISGSAGGGDNWSTKGLRESTFASIRYGTVQEVLGNNTYSILLAGSDEPVILGCDTPLKEGQGVRVAIQNGKYLVEGLSYFINENKEFWDKYKEDADKWEKEIEEAIKNTKDWSEEIEELKRADRQLSGDIFATGQEITNTLRTEIENSEYRSLESVSSTRTELMGQITEEVAQRIEGDNGALLESKSYTDQRVDGITQTVIEEAKTQLGDTFVSRTDFEQTANDFSFTINQALETAEDGKKVATNFLYYDPNGLVVGGSPEEPASGNPKGFNSRLSKTALEMRYDDTVLSSFGNTSTTIGRTDAENGIYLEATPTEVSFHKTSDGSTTAEFSPTGIQIGEDDKTNVVLLPTQLQFKDGDKFLSYYGASGSVIGDITTQNSNVLLLKDTGVQIGNVSSPYNPNSGSGQWVHTPNAQFSPDSVRIGRTNSYNTLLTAGSLSFNKGNTSVAEFNSEGARIGEDDNDHMTLDNTGMSLFTTPDIYTIENGKYFDLGYANYNGTAVRLNGYADRINITNARVEYGSGLRLDAVAGVNSALSLLGSQGTKETTSGGATSYTRLLGAQILYNNNNGTTGTINLGVNPSRYSWIMVEFHAPGTFRYDTIWCSDTGNYGTGHTSLGTKYFALSSTTLGGGNLYIHTQWIYFSGTSLYRDNTHAGYFQANYGGNITGLDMGDPGIVITKVVGFY